MSWVQRLHKLQMRVAEVEVGQAKCTVINDLAEQHRQAHAVAVDRQRLLGVCYQNRNMVQSLKHRLLRSVDELELARGPYGSYETPGAPVGQLLGVTVAGGPYGSNEMPAVLPPSIEQPGELQDSIGPVL